MKKILLILLLSVHSGFADYNYAEALQKAIFFMEGQQSGRLSPNNRVEWRGPAHTEDGRDAGIDLSGGWYDAGDHWKTNTTMASAITTMSWSVLRFPEAFEKTGQMDELLENLKYGTDYFLKCIIDANPDNPHNFETFDVYFDVGNSLGPQPSVHSVWCAPEVTNGYTVREALRVNADAPGPDIAAKMAAAMAAASLVFHSQDSYEYAEKLYEKSVKLFSFADKYPFDDNTLREEGVYALTPDDEFRQVGYRNQDPREDVLNACGFLQRAFNLFHPDSNDRYYLDYARDLYDSILEDYQVWEYFPWWKTHNRISPIMSLLETAKDAKDIAEWEDIVYDHVKAWEELPPTPGGYRIRDVFGGAFTLLKGTNETFLAMLYSNWTTDTERKQRFFDFAKSQMDYLLGDNPCNKSYMVGFGDKGWFNSLHHRSAQGPWAGFAHIQENSPLFLQECRHILYGAVPGGPDLNDEYEALPGDWKHSEVTLTSGASVIGVLAGLIAQNPDVYQPIPDSQFPPKEERDLSLDPAQTDREFFVVTRIRTQRETSLKVLAQLNNRSAWPARVTDSLSFRCYFTLDNGASVDDIRISLQSTRNGQVGPVTPLGENVCYVEFSKPGEEQWPNADGNGGHYSSSFTILIEVDSAEKWHMENDWSFAGMTKEGRINEHVTVYENGRLLAGIAPFANAVAQKPPSARPQTVKLYRNYPNPFNPATAIRFDLAAAGRVRVDIFDIKGRFVKSLINKKMHAGTHHVLWNATDQLEYKVSSGVYYCRLYTKDGIRTQKLLFLR